MGFSYLHKVPSAAEVVAQMPLSDDLKAIKTNRDNEIRAVFEGRSNKFLVIIGPCSADNEDAVCEYATKLSRLQNIVQDKLILIPRVYTNKPRTTGEGYKGMMHQPDPEEDPNIAEGVRALRKMHLRVLQESRLSVADEMLYPENYPYLEDVLSYVAIGARSVENQQHRLTVSGLDIPAGMKNPTSGDLTVMLNSVYAAQIPHIFLYNGWEVKTTGNPYAHCVLRGAMNQYGLCIANYHYEDLIRLVDMYTKRNLSYPTIVIDTNHANSNKQYAQQPRIAIEVMENRKRAPLLKTMVKGVMIESYLVEGAQEPSGKIYGKSITDACLGWEDSQELLMQLADCV